MAIYLPPTADEEQLALDELTPREIVAELDKYVVGQHQAKRAVAIALRNRMRRQKLAPELAERSEERRVGKECRRRRSTNTYTKKQNKRKTIEQVTVG